MNSEWRSMLLGDFIDLKRGYDLPKSQRTPGNVPLVSSAGISDLHDEAKVRGPGVVTGRYGTIGEVFFIDKDFWPLNTTLYVKDFRGNDPRFTYYFLKTIDYFQYSDKAAVPSVNRNHLHMTNIKVPVSISEQKRIASTLAVLDNKIEVNRQLNQTLEKMDRAIFKSWFVDFDPVKAKIAAKQRWFALQPAEEPASPACYADEAGSLPDLETYMTLAAMQAISGKDEEQLARMQTEQPEQYAELRTTAELFPSAMQDSESGEIPQGWAIGPFSRITRLDTTSVKPGDEPDREWEHYSIPAFDENASPTYELGQKIKSGKYKVLPAAVLSSKLNPHFPRTWVPDVQDPNVAICSTEFMQFVPAEHQHRPFVAGMVASEPFQKGIMMRVTGSTGSRQRAQPKQVAAMDVVLPTSELVTTYSLRTKAMCDIQARNIRQTRSLVSLRDVLLPKLLSGELLVTDVGTQTAEVE